MSTTEQGYTVPEKVRVLEFWALNFTNTKSTNIAERKGDFTLKTRWSLMDSEGNNSMPEPPKPCSKILSVAETKLMMADSVTLADGTVLTGAQIAEGVSLSTDKDWAGEYDIIQEENIDPIVEE